MHLPIPHDSRHENNLLWRSLLIGLDYLTSLQRKLQLQKNYFCSSQSVVISVECRQQNVAYNHAYARPSELAVPQVSYEQGGGGGGGGGLDHSLQLT